MKKSPLISIIVASFLFTVSCYAANLSIKNVTFREAEKMFINQKMLVICNCTYLPSVFGEGDGTYPGFPITVKLSDLPSQTLQPKPTGGECVFITHASSFSKKGAVFYQGNKQIPQSIFSSSHHGWQANNNPYFSSGQVWFVESNAYYNQNHPTPSLECIWGCGI